jgi:hypothetical protein
LGLEKTRQTKMAKNELYDKNGKFTTDENEIMEIEVKQLYKSTNLIVKIKDFCTCNKFF